MSQHVQIIFIKDNPDHKKPPFEVIQELANGNRYIESVVLYDQISGVSTPKITPWTDFPFMAYFSEDERAKVPTIRPKNAKIIKYNISDNQLFHFIGTLQSGTYDQAHKWTNKLTSEKISHWFIRYHNKESIPDFIFKFLEENNLTYSIIDDH